MNSSNNRTCPLCRRSFPSQTSVCPDDGSLLSEADPLIGYVLDERYEIRELLGMGGMSLVYKAYQRDLDRYVAIKLLKSELTGDATNIARFRREASVASELRHPNLASIYTLGVAPSGRAYIVMELIAGRSLHAALQREHPFSVARTRQIASQIAAAIAHCHAHGIVHRDLKPSNVMLVADASAASADFVKVLDFGTAKLIGNAQKPVQRLTQQGEILGTAMYMAPEQLTAGEVDGRADIYALGRIIYDMASVNLLVPAALAPIASRAMETQADERYQTADEMTEALSKIDNITSDRLLPVASQLAPRRDNRRKQKVLIFTSLATLILVSVAVFYTTTNTPKSEPNPAVIEKIRPAEAPRNLDPDFDRCGDLCRQGQLDEADKLCHELLDKADKGGFAKSIFAAETMRVLASVESQRHHPAKAIRLLTEAFNMLSSFSVIEQSRPAQFESELASEYGRAGDQKTARKLFDDALATIHRVSPMSIDESSITGRYADYLRSQGNREGALASYHRAAMIFRRSPKMLNYAYALSIVDLLKELGRTVEAKAWKDEADRLRSERKRKEKLLGHDL